MTLWNATPSVSGPRVPHFGSRTLPARAAAASRRQLVGRASPPRADPTNLACVLASGRAPPGTREQPPPASPGGLRRATRRLCSCPCLETVPADTTCSSHTRPNRVGTGAARSWCDSTIRARTLALARDCETWLARAFSRARHVLAAAELAPGNAETRAALTDPASARCNRVSPSRQRFCSSLQFRPSSPTQLTSSAVARSLRESKRGSAPVCQVREPSTTSCYWAMRMTSAITEAANLLSQAAIPLDIAEGIAMMRTTAIRNPGGGVRGIATGDMFRRLCGRLDANLRPSYKAVRVDARRIFDQATRPYQRARCVINRVTEVVANLSGTY